MFDLHETRRQRLNWSSEQRRRQRGARWNPAGLAALYASLTPETALAEALAELRYYGFPAQAAMPRTFVAIAVRLERVLDLTDGEVRKALRVSRRRMVGTDWRREQEAGRVAMTQVIGRAANEAGLEALHVPCAALPGGSNLVVFPGRLTANSRLEVLGGDEL